MKTMKQWKGRIVLMNSSWNNWNVFCHGVKPRFKEIVGKSVVEIWQTSEQYIPIQHPKKTSKSWSWKDVWSQTAFKPIGRNLMFLMAMVILIVQDWVLVSFLMLTPSNIGKSCLLIFLLLLWIVDLILDCFWVQVFCLSPIMLWFSFVKREEGLKNQYLNVDNWPYQTCI